MPETKWFVELMETFVLELRSFMDDIESKHTAKKWK
jgi:hypothetical protein